MLGDPRVNQNPAFLALGIVFYRWHNVQAEIVREKHPEWIDEDVFQAARRRVVATLQVGKKQRKLCIYHLILKLFLAPNVSLFTRRLGPLRMRLVYACKGKK